MSELTDATPAERHRMLAAQFTTLVDGVQRWDAPTPVTEWRAVDIVEHLAWLPSLLANWGVTLEVPAADGPVEQFLAQTRALQEALDGPDAHRPVDTRMMGVKPFDEVIDTFYNFDLFAHSWDLAKASGQSVDLDADYAAQAYAGMAAMGPALHESGQFGTPQPVADDAPPQEKLLALIGRDVNWSGPQATA